MAACVLHTPSPYYCSGGHKTTSTPNHDTSGQPRNNVTLTTPTLVTLAPAQQRDSTCSPTPYAIFTMGSHYSTMPHFDSGDSVPGELATYMIHHTCLRLLISSLQSSTRNPTCPWHPLLATTLWGSGINIPGTMGPCHATIYHISGCP